MTVDEPDPEDVFWRRAEFYFDAGRYEDVVAVVTAHWREHPDCPTGYAWIACVERERGRRELSVAAAQKRVALDPTNPYAHHFASQIFRHFSLGDEALVSSEQARLLSPKNPQIRAGHAQSLLLIDRFDEALVEARAAFELAPDDEETLIALMNVLLAAGRSEESLGLAASPPVGVVNDPTFHRIVGSAHRALGRLDESRDAFRESLRLYPKSLWTRRALRDVEIKSSRSFRYASALGRYALCGPPHDPFFRSFARPAIAGFAAWATFHATRPGPDVGPNDVSIRAALVCAAFLATWSFIRVTADDPRAFALAVRFGRAAGETGVDVEDRRAAEWTRARAILFAGATTVSALSTLHYRLMLFAILLLLAEWAGGAKVGSLFIKGEIDRWCLYFVLSVCVAGVAILAVYSK